MGTYLVNPKNFWAGAMTHHQRGLCVTVILLQSLFPQDAEWRVQFEGRDKILFLFETTIQFITK